MEFYSTYYKKLANYGQTKEIGEKFDLLDANGDKALNKDEMVNIFAQQTLTEAEKELLMAGIDGNDDGFITYQEFIPAFIEFDIDQNAEISLEEFDFTKKRIKEMEIQDKINDQYAILNNLTSTPAQKQEAQKKIETFNVKRRKIYIEQDIKKKEILISDKDAKIQQIQTLINEGSFLEFEEAQKLKEIEQLEAEKELMLKEKDVSVKKRSIEVINLAIINAQQDGDAYEIARLEQEKISKENKLKISEKNLELLHKQAKIESNEKLLTKFFVPDIMKDNARKELDLLYDDVQLSNQMKDLYLKTSRLSQTRADIYETINTFIESQTEDLQAQLRELDLQELLAYIQANDPATHQQLQALNEQQLTQQLEAQISSLKVDLLDKMIQLKAVLPKSTQKPFDEVKANLEAEIADLQTQIAELEAQL